MRVGFGYDIHPLVPDRALILGGVTIPFNRGLEGHSDADVLCHAVSDAFLGAASLGDIGEHFPDTDPAFRDASSLDLLKRVGAMVVREGFRAANIDTVVVAESPKLQPFRDEIAGNIAGVLDLEVSQVSIKATTHEGFGDVGRGGAIAVYAVVCLESRS